MSDVQLSVRPAQGGWMMYCGLTEPVAFSSGGKAESGARNLGQVLAHAGRDVTVTIHDWRDCVVGTTRYFGGPL